MAGEASGPPIDRREALRRAVLLVGGAGAASALAACGGEKKRAREPASGGASLPARRYFTPERMALLEAVAAAMIPATDTPGAIEAGVPAFVDDMMADWASAATRAKTDAVLDAIDKTAAERFGAGFHTLADDRRLAALRAFDAANIRAAGGGYGDFKQLLLLGYYHSEIGATEELQYEFIPGAWVACAPLADIGRAWAD